MKKFITLLHVLEHLVTEEDIQEILQAQGYKDTARKLSVSLLLRFLIKELLLTDSTTITVGESRLPRALYHGKRSGIKLHVALLEASKMPCKVRETTGLHHDSPIDERIS
ncbi:hypothetical protein [Aneurinibacillus migulanus]|uniref:Uncharacterized protein n=1 Tax=Aneurinibacillus migulanus TaxID=47500 RepID=A0A1G9C7Y5_ANEMI|nr:hypothetical protein [Aneurinibacillus migulanus]MED0894324.1 hypothetical protein [Aneurinibacillus migulanus]MED1618984.1 hypothetical protein [Aneurinibacillus migulanus]GED17707.1 hypothetical protein AMI01nite_56980 [Aneurinibacillus migulanus]SDK47797.1 hypothetical protein SAMN04487909_15912 [Aneurinibacillus migulanus]